MKRALLIVSLVALVLIVAQNVLDPAVRAETSVAAARFVATLGLSTTEQASLHELGSNLAWLVGLG